MPKKLLLLVGPPGCGKSTIAKEYETNLHYERISQDDQGKEGHMTKFLHSIKYEDDIVVDRMNFSKEQRERYIKPAEEAGYHISIVVLHHSYQTCLERCLKREGHPTIKDEANARSALQTFFTKYQRVEDDEADVVHRAWPDCIKEKTVICDIDGTMANIDHRLHFMKPEPGKKKDWKNFFANVSGDDINEWCNDLVEGLIKQGVQVIFCSGRPDNLRKETQEWLNNWEFQGIPLYMRHRNDHRADDIVKEIILDFEILTRYIPYFAIDDRSRVVDMWRKRGIVCLQCAKGDF